jgi:hypothetical protein
MAYFYVRASRASILRIGLHELDLVEPLEPVAKIKPSRSADYVVS